jgi:hypothetical protein
MSIFEKHSIMSTAQAAGIVVTLLNENELLKFAQSIEHQVVHALQSDPTVYDYTQTDVERAFKLAVKNLGIHLLDDMKLPVENREEGQLTAVSRGLYTPGEKYRLGPGGEEATANGYYEQFYDNFSKFKPKAVAFMKVERYRSIGKDSFNPMWCFKIRYATL